MTAVVKINIDELDNNFVEHLKREFAHASLEIRVHDQEDTASAFAESDFWNLIELMDWSEEEDDAKVVERIPLSIPILQAVLAPLKFVHKKKWKEKENVCGGAQERCMV
jgi:hypothetical protein